MLLFCCAVPGYLKRERRRTVTIKHRDFKPPLWEESAYNVSPVIGGGTDQVNWCLYRTDGVHDC